MACASPSQNPQNIKHHYKGRGMCLSLLSPKKTNYFYKGCGMCLPPPPSIFFQTKIIIFIKNVAYVSPPQTLAELIIVIEGVAYFSPPCKANYCHVGCGTCFIALVCVEINTIERNCKISLPR